MNAVVELANARMPFDKYRGRLLIDVPEHYLVWLKRHGFPSGKLGELLESALAVKTNGLQNLLRPLQSVAVPSEAQPPPPRR
jgi:uncharacterized protein (DUF3820 family)